MDKIFIMFNESTSDLETASNASGQLNIFNNKENEQSTLDVVIRSVIVCLGIVVLVENLLILVAAARNRALRDNIHYNLVLSLSFSDLLLGLNLIIYGIIFTESDEGIKMGLVCVIIFCLWCITTLMSFLQTFYISLNRYLVISENQLNQVLWNGNRKYLVYSLSWVGIIVLVCSLVSPKGDECTLKPIYGDNFSIFKGVYYSFYSLLLFLTLLFYMLALWKIRKRYKKTEHNANSSNIDNTTEHLSHIKHRRMLKSMKLVGIITATLLILSGPMALWGLTHSSHLTYRIFAFCVILNSVINPIIYCLNIEGLKKEIKSMFTSNRN